MKEIFYFTAEWCGPCKTMKPIVLDLVKEYPKVKFNLVDADEQFNLAHILGVRSVPTLIIMKGNSELKRLVGSKNKEELIDFFEFASEE